MLIGIEEKSVVFLHINTSDSESIYNCVHLFILPFLRFITGRKKIITSIKTKVIVSIHNQFQFSLK